MLHAVPKVVELDLYCGPTSICAVTGRDPLEVLDAVRLYTHENGPVRAMCDYTLVGVLGYLGYAIRAWEPFTAFSRLDKYLDNLNPHDGVEVLSLHRHFTAVSYTEMVDTGTFGRVVPLFGAPRMYSTVQTAFEVLPVKPRPQQPR